MLRFESFDSRYMVRCVVFRLKLTNVTLRDAGLYTCEGFNTFGRQLTTGQLIVRRGMSTEIVIPKQVPIVQFAYTSFFYITNNKNQRKKSSLHCALASGAVYCNRSCLCVCRGRPGGRAVSVTTITRNCVHRSSPNWVCTCR